MMDKGGKKEPQVLHNLQCRLMSRVERYLVWIGQGSPYILQTLNPCSLEVLTLFRQSGANDTCGFSLGRCQN